MTEIFDLIYNLLYENTFLILLGSFLWGIGSVIFSPCHLASFPLIVGFITKEKRRSIKRSFFLSLLFSLGIFISLLIIGFVTIAAGRIAGDLGIFPQIVVGLILILTGLYFMNLIPLNWNNLPIDKLKLNSNFSIFIFGLLLGIGLGPCTFAFMAPVLGIIFEYADRLPLVIGIIASFSIGHCLGVVLGGTLSELVIKYMNWTSANKLVSYIRFTCGVLVIFGGVYMIIKDYLN
ncbi:MAG: cytochrome C biogenesis protein [Candidatus Delongbacteria bacterium]|nr:cytochrome C biogenesis protein [Candidatus Delongbacteria bacterium]MBN2836907.1 cytochrome C biogenesis protein [Candidatus Delongbacteria bacterium]